MSDAEALLEPQLRKAGFAEEALPCMESVYRFAMRLTAGNASEAEDLVQDTFLRAYRAWETYTPGTSCRSWLFTICRNLFLRSRERSARRPEHAATDLDVNVEAVAAASTYGRIHQADPAQSYFDSLVDAEVMNAVEALPPDFREVVVLSDLEGLTYQEIADVIESPLGTVKSRLYRGRRLLAEKLYAYAVEMGHVRGGER